MKYKVAVVGGGPSGACAAEIFAKEKNVDTVLFERKMDNAKPCGGAIPLCMIGEFDIPETTVDRKVRVYLYIIEYSIVCLLLVLMWCLGFCTIRVVNRRAERGRGVRKRDGSGRERESLISTKDVSLWVFGQ